MIGGVSAEDEVYREGVIHNIGKKGEQVLYETCFFLCAGEDFVLGAGSVYLCLGNAGKGSGGIEAIFGAGGFGCVFFDVSDSEGV